MARPVFSLSGAGVRRNGRQILQDIDWSVERDQHWVIVGGNGSGKTSLLNVLMGYLTPTAGEVVMAGREDAVTSESQSWDDWRKNIGYVSSSLAQWVDPGETAIEVVASGKHAVLNSWQIAEERDLAKAAKVMAQVDCAHLRDQTWNTLSQGERQRVLIGRALMAPGLNLLILDEPCAGLDPVAREHFLGFIDDLTKKRTFRSLVLVTHHVEEIVPSITHALVLKEGRCVARGEKRQALRSATLSEAFGEELRLRSRLGRYRLYFPEEFEAEQNQIL